MQACHEGDASDCDKAKLCLGPSTFREPEVFRIEHLKQIN
jgi:hypothetical protein